MTANDVGEAGVTQARHDPTTSASPTQAIVPQAGVARAVQTPTPPATDATEVKLSGEWPDGGGEIYWGRNAPQHGGGHYLGVSGTEVASVTIPDADRMRVATVLDALVKSLRRGKAGHHDGRGLRAKGYCASLCPDKKKVYCHRDAGHDGEHGGQWGKHRYAW